MSLTPQQFVDAMTDLFNAVSPETPDDIDETLRDEGYVPESIAARMSAAAARALSDAVHVPRAPKPPDAAAEEV
jgi:hypothetical protein